MKGNLERSERKGGRGNDPDLKLQDSSPAQPSIHSIQPLLLQLASLTEHFIDSLWDDFHMDKLQ
jgi:hypothetical protein